RPRRLAARRRDLRPRPGAARRRAARPRPGPPRLARRHHRRRPLRPGLARPDLRRRHPTRVRRPGIPALRPHAPHPLVHTGGAEALLPGAGPRPGVRMRRFTRAMEGPLHRKLVKEVSTGDRFAWVEHDLARYRGERVHVEFTPADGAEFAVALVAQGERPPGDPERVSPRLLTLLADDNATPQSLAAAYQRWVADVLRAAASDRLADIPDDAPLADRLLS